MPISDKTRKMLWAKSGNRCLICRIELVQQEETTTENLIIGEECHIVSKKQSGPRYEADFMGDHDAYENLALLCANDHKRIDELTETYTKERLSLFKQVHENWVKTTLERDVMAFTNDQLNIKSLPQITTGKQLVDLVNGVHMYDFDHDQLDSNDKALVIGGLFDELRDLGDISSNISFSERSAFGLSLNDTIEQIHTFGFKLYGLRRKLKIRDAQKADMGIYDTATLVIVRQNNPGIVGDFLIAQFPKHSSINF